MGFLKGSWLHLSRCIKNNCGFADDYFMIAKKIRIAKQKDGGSKGELAPPWSLYRKLLRLCRRLFYDREKDKDSEAKRWVIQGGASSTLVAVPKIIAALPLSFLVAK
jgi:hypothetical protein